MTKEELKLHIENRYYKCSKRNIALSYGSFYDGYMDCYNELEPEIERLKNSDLLCKVIGEQKLQIERAKKIIKELLKHNIKMHEYVIYNLDEDELKEADMFLKNTNGETDRKTICKRKYCINEKPFPLQSASVPCYERIDCNNCAFFEKEIQNV